MSHFFTMTDRLRNCLRLGILGGTFDPIHFGHLAIAEEARECYALDAVLFIPAGAPPHKRYQPARPEQRLLMVQLATANHPKFHVSRLEIDRPGPSYTVDTLQALHAQYPQAELYFIIGADAALEFAGWREPGRILELAHVVAATRPGFPLAPLPHIALLDVPGLAISSTELRRRASEGRSLRYLVPDAVASYIAKEDIYRQPA